MSELDLSDVMAQTNADTNASLQQKISMVMNKRGVIDTFFFTIIYAVLCYMIALSSFKLIDQVPNQILRWMGEQIKTIQEDGQDLNENFIKRISTGILQITGTIGNNSALLALKA